MKLGRPKSSSSFYETFSDLIFATMAIFVMLLVVFISQVGSDDERLEFTGSSSETYSLISHAEVDDVASVVFFPVSVANRFNLSRSLENNDPLMKLCQYSISGDGLQSIPITEYAKLGSGFSKRFATGVRSQGEGTIELNVLVRALKQSDYDSASALKSSVFGAESLRLIQPGASESSLNLETAFRNAYTEIRRWLESQEPGNLHSWLAKSRLPVRNNAREDGEDMAVVEFSALVEGKVEIGDATLNAAQFRGFLSSISAGRHFSLRHITANGSISPPPAWVIDQILEPTGFMARR